jgi:hypothetical protein
VSELELRAGDEERQATIDRLAAHFRAGRLSDDELEERTAAAHAARTRGDLAALEADLPGEPDDYGALERRLKRRRERIVSAIAVSAFLWVIWLATDPGGFAWPVFPMAAIALGLVLDLWGGRDADDEDEDEDEEDDRRGGLPAPPRPPRLP